MRKLGKRKVSIQRMKEKEKNDKLWRTNVLYIGYVSGITVYCSWILNFLKIINIPETSVNIVGVIMGIVVLMLVYYCGKQKWIEKIHNKNYLERILESCTMIGIFGFVMEKVINVVSIENQTLTDTIPLALTHIFFIALPIGVAIFLLKKEEWKHNED